MSTLIHRLMDVVEATPLENPEEGFARSAFALLALAISKLPPTEREAMLERIEDGSLREAVGQFPIYTSPEKIH
jgi:hypothetical protein